MAASGMSAIRRRRPPYTGLDKTVHRRRSEPTRIHLTEAFQIQGPAGVFSTPFR